MLPITGDSFRQVAMSAAAVVVTIFQVCFLFGWLIFFIDPFDDTSEWYGTELNFCETSCDIENIIFVDRYQLCEIEPLLPVYLNGLGITCIVAFFVMALELCIHHSLSDHRSFQTSTGQGTLVGQRLRYCVIEMDIRFSLTI